MAHTLNLVVVAEGLETLEQLNFLHEKRCDIIQGYLVSRPLQAGDIKPLLINKKQINIFKTEALPLNHNVNVKRWKSLRTRFSSDSIYLTAAQVRQFLSLFFRVRFYLSKY